MMPTLTAVKPFTRNRVAIFMAVVCLFLQAQPAFSDGKEARPEASVVFYVL